MAAGDLAPCIATPTAATGLTVQVGRISCRTSTVISRPLSWTVAPVEGLGEFCDAVSSIMTRAGVARVGSSGAGGTSSSGSSTRGGDWFWQ